MTKYITYRCLLAVPTLLLASVAVWAIVYALPGDPVNAVLGENATAEAIEATRARMGLDQPLVFQYAIWLANTARGDLGVSYTSGFPVSDLIGGRLFATLQLSIAAFVIALIVSLSAATLASSRPNSLGARCIRLLSGLGLAVPSFWVGILMILVFAVNLRWLPAVSDYVPIWDSPKEALRNLAMPAVTLGIFVGAVLGRFLLDSMEVVSQRDHIRAAHAKGLSEAKITVRHVLRNALIPFTTVAGLMFGTFFGGAVVTESVFNYPGLGRLILNAITQRDYLLIQGAVLVVLLIVIMVNIVVDILYAYLDPRIQY